MAWSLWVWLVKASGPTLLSLQYKALGMMLITSPSQPNLKSDILNELFNHIISLLLVNLQITHSLPIYITLSKALESSIKATNPSRQSLIGHPQLAITLVCIDITASSVCNRSIPSLVKPPGHTYTDQDEPPQQGKGIRDSATTHARGYGILTCRVSLVFKSVD